MKDGRPSRNGQIASRRSTKNSEGWAQVISQYAVLGAFDFVSIVDAPNNETIARISVELGSRGTVQIMSLPAIPIDEFTSQLRSR